MKRTLLGGSGLASLIIGETCTVILKALDFIMMSTLASEKMCAICGKQDDSVALNHPLCPTCHMMHEHDEECDDDDSQIHKLPPIGNDIMFR